MDLKSNNNKQIEIDESRYRVCCIDFGDNHPDTIDAVKNLASDYYSVSNYQKSLELYTKAYNSSVNVYGEVSPEVLSCICFLAANYTLLGNIEKAIELTAKANELRKELFTEDDWETLVSKYSEINSKDITHEKSISEDKEPSKSKELLEELKSALLTCKKVGDYKKAMKLCKKLYNLSCRTFGENASETVNLLEELAYYNDKMYNRKELLRIRDKIYNQRRKTFGSNDSVTLIALSDLALAYSLTGNFSKAKKLSDEAYFVCKNAYGIAHPTTTLVLGKYCYIRANSERDAVIQYSDALKCLRETVHVEDSDNILLWNIFIDLFHNREVIPLASDTYQQMYEMKCRTLGGEHLDTLATLNDLAISYKNCKNAIEIYEKIYNTMCEFYSKNHPDTLVVLNNLAISYIKSGNCEKSIDLLKSAYKSSCKTLGKMHPYTLTFFDNMMVAYRYKHGKKRLEEAIIYYVEILYMHLFRHIFTKGVYVRLYDKLRSSHTYCCLDFDRLKIYDPYFEFKLLHFM